jgi:CheY-like chemotaxis protein
VAADPVARHVLVTRPIEEVFTVVGMIPAAEFTSLFAAVPCARLVDAGRAVPTVVIIGGREDAEQDARLRSQACDMLFKPFDPDTLQAAIGSAVSLGQAG